MQYKTILIIITLTLAITHQQSLSVSCFTGQYYSSSTGKCQQCDISCAQCRTSDGCSLCYDQMYLMPVGNKVLCGYCYDVLAGCTVCSSAYKCAQCSNGFFLMSNRTCANCSNLTPNCALCYQNSTSQLYCSACSDSYLLVEGVCVQNATASQIQASRNAIMAGATSNSNNQTNTSSSNKTVQNQKTSQNQTNSSQTTQSQATTSSATTQNITNCNMNFILVGSVCVRVIPFCTQYDSDTQKCDICVSSYSKSNGYCIPDILMLSSLTNQNTKTNQLPLTSTNTQNSSSIMQAASNSEVKICPEGQYLWFGVCIVPGTECKNRDTNNKCTNCINGYTLNNGLCIQQITSYSTNVPESKQIANSSSSDSKNSSNSSTNKGSEANTVTFTVMTFLNQTIEVISSGCNSPCVTCKRDDLNYCVTCVGGMTIVDVFPGVCFNYN